MRPSVVIIIITSHKSHRLTKLNEWVAITRNTVVQTDNNGTPPAPALAREGRN